MSPEVAKKNAEWFAMKKAQREVRQTTKKGGKPKPTARPVSAVPAGVSKPARGKGETPAGTNKPATDAPEAKIRQSSLRLLRVEVKAKFPGIKGMADAKSQELQSVLQAHEGDSIIAELQETWAKRARARHEAWLKGDSKSAKTVRAKLEAKK